MSELDALLREGAVRRVYGLWPSVFIRGSELTPPPGYEMIDATVVLEMYVLACVNDEPRRPAGPDILRYYYSDGGWASHHDSDSPVWFEPDRRYCRRIRSKAPVPARDSNSE